MGALTHLYLDHNELSGPVPANLGQLAALQYLLLNGNQQLTGQEALCDYMEEHSPDCVVDCDCDLYL